MPLRSRNGQIKGYVPLRHDPLLSEVVDDLHVIRLGNAVVDEVRRRVQQDTLGHRDRKGDLLYDVRKLLVAPDRLTDHAHQRIETAWRQGDPWHEVEAAWWGRELLRDVYAAADLEAATTALEAFFAWADQADVPELSRLARHSRPGAPRSWPTTTAGSPTAAPKR